MSGPQISKSCPLLLGSGSPRRRDILSGLGIPCVVLPPSVDETPLTWEAPEPYLERIVASKLAFVRSNSSRVPHAGILVADTSVILEGAIIGKPLDAADALASLRRIVARTHDVKTRYAIATQGGEVRSRTVSTRVSVGAVGDAQLRAYVESGEGLDKAGGYAIQGIGAFLVRSIEGSYTNVVGLPAAEVIEDLCNLGLIGTFPSLF